MGAKRIRQKVIHVVSPLFSPSRISKKLPWIRASLVFVLWKLCFCLFVFRLLFSSAEALIRISHVHFS